MAAVVNVRGLEREYRALLTEFSVVSAELDEADDKTTRSRLLTRLKNIVTRSRIVLEQYKQDIEIYERQVKHGHVDAFWFRISEVQ